MAPRKTKNSKKTEMSIENKIVDSREEATKRIHSTPQLPLSRGTDSLREKILCN